MSRLKFVVPASAGQFVVPALAGRRLKAELQAGFTLVELLITITIISILVTMSVGAVFMAQEEARQERTQGLVGKLHNVVIDRWETYRTRRLALIVTTSPANRLYGIRELMRMEMPDRYEDIVFTPTFVAPSPMRHTYERRIDSALKKYNTANGTSLNRNQFITTVLWNPTNPNESAECLYLLISASMSADERAEFRDKDYADTNGNFMPEFIDAWGKPIRFLRWAPGVQSDVQWFESYQDANNNSRYDVGETYTDTDGDGRWDARDPINHHDPFDAFGLEIGDIASSISKPTAGIARGSGEPNVPYWGFTILPFIYSAGPDSEYGIYECLYPTPAVSQPAALNLLAKNRNPYCRYLVSGTYYWRGEPDVLTNGIVHLDNIHNHNPVGFGK